MPQVGSENFVKQAFRDCTNPISLIWAHPNDRHIAHVWDTARINVAEAIHDYHWHMPSFGFNYLYTAPIAGRVGVRVQRHEGTGFDLMQYNLLKG